MSIQSNFLEIVSDENVSDTDSSDSPRKVIIQSIIDGYLDFWNFLYSEINNKFGSVIQNSSYILNLLVNEYKSGLEENDLRGLLIDSIMHAMNNKISIVRLGLDNNNDVNLLPFVDVVISSLNRIQEVISSDDQLQMEEVDIVDIVNQVAGSEGLSLDLTGSIMINTYPLFLSEIIRELIWNSRKNYKSEGQLIINIVLSNKDGSVKIVYTDNGNGFENTQLDILNKSFENDDYNQDTSGGGGFGNQFIKRAIQVMGGNVVFGNKKEGSGVQVVITLPLEETSQ